MLADMEMQAALQGSGNSSRKKKRVVGGKLERGGGEAPTPTVIPAVAPAVAAAHPRSCTGSCARAPPAHLPL